MIVELDIVQKQNYRVCIVGAGAAGIILALEYAKANPSHTVLLVECGRDESGSNPLDDSIENRSPNNHHDPYECTNKGVGGSTATWGGRCVMYDEIDFLPHGPVQASCTWRQDFLDSVSTYLQTACDYFHCGRAQFELKSPAPIAEHFKSSTVTDNRLERWSLPTRFGKAYRSDLEQIKNIHLVSGYYATDFGELEEQGKVNSLKLKSLVGEQTASVSADTFVLCAGGQESTRLLLKSPQLFAQRGSTPDALGKYYQGHSSGKLAFIKFYGDPRKTEFAFSMDDGTYCRRRFQFSKEAILQHQLLNIAFWLDIHPVYDPSHRNGILSFIYLMMIAPVLRKKLLPPAIARSLTAGKSSRVSEHLANVVRGLPTSVVSPAIIFAKRYLRRRKLPGVYLRSKENRYALHFHCEQVPSCKNYMALTSNGSSLEIHYEYTDEDVETVIRSHELLDNYLRQLGCGELEYIYDKDDLPRAIRHISKDGLHQVGTTRISKTPNEGVVDYDLKVWGTKNLYVCSSSVFPTSSQANPTFFLGACAVRLSHQLTIRARQ
jgi:hypothetical protein